jgi:murein DD-endopeptidase MepM/ murein hydrolase activator NlpD
MVPRRTARRLGGAVLLLAATTGLVAAPAAARPGRSAPRPHAVRPTDDFEGASQAEQDALSALAAARGRSAETASRLDAANAEVARAQDRLNQVNADRLRLEQARRNVEAELLRTTQRADRARARARQAAAVLYRNSGGGPELVFGTAPTGPRTRRSEYLRRVGSDLTGQVDGLRAAEDDARRTRRELVRRRAAVEKIAVVADRQLATLGAQRDTLAHTLIVAKADEGRVQQVLAAAQARKAEFERAAAASAAASTSVGQILESRAGGQPAPGGVRLRFPADGPISSSFGRRLHPIFHTWRMHTGVDIGAGYGSPVRAAAGGQVVVAGVITGYGNAIVVDHGNGLATLYGHLSRFAVHRGEQVDPGETIGAVGNTGNSTGPHLHFEVRVNGTPVDPMPYLPS